MAVTKILSNPVWISYILMALLSFMIITDLVQDHTPPIENVSYEPRNSPMEQGEDLILRVYRDKNRDDCPITSVRRATHAETGITYSLPGRIWEGGEVGTEYSEFVVGTSSLPVGQYVGHIETRYDCPNDVFIYEGQFLFLITDEVK